MIDLLIVNDKKSSGTSIQLNLQMPEFLSTIQRSFDDSLCVHVAQGANTDELVSSSIDRLNDTAGRTAFSVTVLDVHMDGTNEGALLFVQKFLRSHKIEQLGQILLISDRASSEDGSIAKLLKDYGAIYKSAGTRPHRQEAVAFAIRKHFDNLKQ